MHDNTLLFRGHFSSFAQLVYSATEIYNPLMNHLATEHVHTVCIRSFLFLSKSQWMRLTIKHHSVLLTKLSQTTLPKIFLPLILPVISMITKVHFLAVIVCVPTFRNISHGVYVDWFAITPKHVRKSDSKSENKQQLREKKLAPPHFVIPPFLIDTEKKRYNAGIACQADQEEAAVFLLSNHLQQSSRDRQRAIKLCNLHTLAD